MMRQTLFLVIDFASRHLIQNMHRMDHAFPLFDEAGIHGDNIPMEYNVTEAIIDLPFGPNRGESEALALLLSSPLVDVKLIVLSPENAKEEFRSLLLFLSAMGKDDIPIALGESIEGGFLRDLPSYRGKVFASAFEAYGATLPRMHEPQVLCLGKMDSLLIAKPFLHQSRARLVLQEEAAKRILSSGEHAEKKFEEILYDPRIDLLVLGKQVSAKSAFSVEEAAFILASSSPAGKALNAYAEGHPPTLDSSALGFAFALLFPQNLDLEIKTIVQGKREKEYVLAPSIHKVRAIREVCTNLLCNPDNKGKDLQIAEIADRLRICYPTSQAIDGLYVYEAGWEKHRPGDRYGPAIRDFFFLHLILQGKGTLTLGETSHPLNEGDVFLLPAGRNVKIEADPLDPYEYYWVGFGGHDAERLVDSCGFSEANHFTLHPSEIADLRNELALLSSASSRGLGTSYWMLGHLCLIFSQLAFLRPAPKTKKRDYVQEAIRYMDEFYPSGISISDVCSHIAIERTYFFRRFKRETGWSPQEYLVSLRLEKAKELLRSTNKPVLKIAEEVGYPNYVAFLKLFARKNGCSPTQYRGKSHQSKTE